MQIVRHDVGGVLVEPGERIAGDALLELRDERHRPADRLGLDAGGEPELERHDVRAERLDRAASQRAPRVVLAEACHHPLERRGAAVRVRIHLRLRGAEIAPDLLLDAPRVFGRCRTGGLRADLLDLREQRGLVGLGEAGERRGGRPQQVLDALRLPRLEQHARLREAALRDRQLAGHVDGRGRLRRRVHDDGRGRHPPGPLGRHQRSPRGGDADRAHHRRGRRRGGARDAAPPIAEHGDLGDELGLVHVLELREEALGRLERLLEPVGVALRERGLGLLHLARGGGQGTRVLGLHRRRELVAQRADLRPDRRALVVGEPLEEALRGDERRLDLVDAARLQLHSGLHDAALGGRGGHAASIPKFGGRGKG